MHPHTKRADLITSKIFLVHETGMFMKPLLFSEFQVFRNEISIIVEGLPRSTSALFASLYDNGPCLHRRKLSGIRVIRSGCICVLEKIYIRFDGIRNIKANILAWDGKAAKHYRQRLCEFGTQNSTV